MEPPIHGSVCWHEIYAPNAAGAKAFYSALFGWSFAPMEGMQYDTASCGGKPFGGVMDTSGPEWQGVPAHWLVYFAVDDVDAAVAKVAALGGSSVMPAFDIPVGRLAIVKDPHGAVFALYKSAPPPAG